MSTRLEALRVGAGKSKQKLAHDADLNPSTITWAEQRGFRLYDGQLAKLAAALGWEGDPADLLVEVEEGSQA